MDRENITGRNICLQMSGVSASWQRHEHKQHFYILYNASQCAVHVCIEPHSHNFNGASSQSSYYNANLVRVKCPFDCKFLVEKERE